MRVPKPFFRKQTQSWYVSIDGTFVPLGTDEKQAWTRYHEVMADRAKHLPTIGDDAVVSILNHYLTWLELNRAATTFDRRKPILLSFGNYLGTSQKLRALRPFHVQQWIDKHYSDPDRHSDTYRNTLITAIKTFAAWAEEMGYVERSPIAKMKKPTAAMRQLFMPSNLWPDVLAAARDNALREFLWVMLDSGARVEEMFRVEARHLDRANRRIHFAKEESKGRKRPRTIYLPDASLAVVSRLADEHPQGKLFRNSRGKPWNKNSMRCRFRYLQAKLKQPGLCATTLRHSFAYHRLVNGQPLIAVQKLMGHVDGRMLETRYSHLQQDTSFMQGQANQLNASQVAMLQTSPSPSPVPSPPPLLIDVTSVPVPQA